MAIKYLVSFYCETVLKLHTLSQVKIYEKMGFRMILGDSVYMIIEN